MAGLWTMADTLGWAGAGLVLDIVGVSLLFWTSLPRHVGAALSFKLVSEMTPNEGEEWVHPYSSKEHKQRLARTEQAVRRNTCMSLSALALIIVGFVLQLLEIVL